MSTPTNKFLLSISSTPDGAEVNLHANLEGLRLLEGEIKSLLKALENGDCPHSHLMTPTWGSDTLSESMLDEERDEGCKQVNHLKLYAWTSEWQKKHGL